MSICLTATCKTCGQLLPVTRLGVRMTALKAQIFDLVKRGGEDGIPSSDLFDQVYSGTTVQWNTVKSHIKQINDLLEDTGYRIEYCCAAGASEPGYRLANTLKRKTRHG